MKLAAVAAIAALVLAPTTLNAHALTSRPGDHANPRDQHVRVARAVNPATQSVVNGPCGETPNPVEPSLAASGETPPGMKRPGLNGVAVNPGSVQPVMGAVDQNICDDTICVSLPGVAASIHAQLDCNVVGYAFFVGNALSGPKSFFGAYGEARTAANPPFANFTPESKMQIASASKVLTALAVLKIMGSNINNPASNYFPWTLPSNSIVTPITVRRFVSQTSGVMQYYASTTGQDYAGLQSFFTQNITNPNALYYCPGPPNPTPKTGPPIPLKLPNPIIATTQACYTDTNFGLMRVVLPRAAGSNSSDPLTLANTYISQVWQNVFFPVGVNGVGCRQPASGYALGYNFPGTAPGTNFGGDLRLSCGDSGWWVSVRDYASVLVSLNAQDGKILGNCGLDDMVTNPSNHPVGWDTKSDGTHRWVEKNGGDTWTTSAGSGVVSTSVAIYGGTDGCVVKGSGTAPVPGVAAVLFINSNNKSANVGADTVLLNALHAATTAKP